MSTARIALNRRELDILYFLWRWKVSTTAALWHGFFSGRTGTTAHKRLWELEQADLIQSLCDWRSHHHLWTLNKKGFQIVRSSLPKLEQEGFSSENLSHDLITTAVHLGDYLFGMPENAALFSEQELRRLPVEFYPEWVPKNNTHRADGYWHVPIAKPMGTVALECELSPKKDVEYAVIADFYSSEPKVLRVLWLVSTPERSIALHRKIMESLHGRPMIHDFVSYSKFQLHGWDSPIEAGTESGKPIRFLLGNFAPTSPKLVGPKLLLDTRKCPHKSQTCRLVEPGCFRY